MMTFNHILSRPAAMLLLSLALGACSSSSEPAPASDDNRGVALCFSVAADTDASRAADPCTGEEEASAWENHIILGNSTVLVFKHDGTLLKSASGNELKDVTLSDDKSTITATIRLDDPYLLDLKQATIDIAVVANVNFTKPLAENVTTIDDIADMISVYALPKVNDDDSGIPMWGFRKSVSLGYLAGEGTQDNPLQCGTVNMLRAWAKINLITSSLPEGYTVSDVTFNTTHPTFYTAPYDVRKIYARNTENITAPCPTEPGNLTAIAPAATSGATTIFYAPETGNSETGNSETRHYIELSLNDPDGKPVADKQNVKIPVCLYDTATGEPTGVTLDLIRNHIYSFDLMYDADADITLQVRVKKWGYHKIIFDM